MCSRGRYSVYLSRWKNGSGPRGFFLPFLFFVLWMCQGCTSSAEMFSLSSLSHFFYCLALHSLPSGTTETRRAVANKREVSLLHVRCFVFTWKRLAVAKLFMHFFACVFRGAILLILSWFLLISVVYGYVKLTGEEKEWSLKHKVCSFSNGEQKRLKTCSQYAELLLI